MREQVRAFKVALQEKEQVLAAQTSLPQADSKDALTAQDKLDFFMCMNHLLEINAAGERWARSHDGFLPTSLSDLSEELAPMMLVCPASKPKSLAGFWKITNAPNFDPATISYLLTGPGLKWGGTSHSFVFCPIHQIETANHSGMIGYPDSSSVWFKLYKDLGF